MSLAKRLKHTRKQAGLTLEQLANEAGVSKTYLWELEQDTEGERRPSADVLLRLSNALKTTIAELLNQPVVRVNEAIIDVSKSLLELRDWMSEIKEPLADEEFRDLAAMRFGGGQPRSKDDWYDLYRTLKRTTRR